MSELLGEQEECCGNCRFHKRDRYEGVWFCINKESEMYGRHTRNEHQCEKHERAKR